MAQQECAQFWSPAKLIFGPGAIQRIPEELRAGRRGLKVLVVTDSGLVQAGVVEKVAAVLSRSRIRFVLFDEVTANPPVEVVHRGYETFKGENCNTLIGLGGGSPMDTAKMIGVLASHGGRILDYTRPNTVKKALPFLLCVPTTYGTGSEVTPYAVVTDVEKQSKIPVIGPLIIPKVAVLDPELSVALPLPVAGATGMDALIHAIECYTNLVPNILSDAMAIEAIAMISSNLREAAANDQNIEATQNMLLGSTMAGIAFSQTRVGNVHAMSHQVSALFGVPHGVANAVLLPYVMAFNLIGCSDKFVEIAVAMEEDAYGLPGLDGARKAVDAVRKLASDVGIPGTLSEVGVHEEAIPEMAKDAMTSGNILVNARKTTIEDVIEIYRRAM